MTIGTQPSICGLPDEIILQVLRFSGWRGATNLGQACRRFYEVCNDNGYWREQVTESFAVNNSHDLFEGGKWKQAFRTLIDGRVYAWGKGTGFMFDVRVPRGWDQDAHVPIEVGALRGEKIVDIATGGWCTTMLTLSGEILMAGTFDRSPRPWTNQPRRLNFPAPNTRIIQFSAGRTHLLALSDRGEIWTYRDQPHIIKFFEFDYAHGNMDNGIHGRVKKVVAGWGASAAIVEGYGVVIWWGDLQHRDPSEDLIREGYRFMNDGAHIWRVYTKKIPFLAPWRHFSPRAATTPSESRTRHEFSNNGSTASSDHGDYLTQHLSDLQLPEYHLHPKGPLRPNRSLDDEVIDLMVGEDFLVAVTRVGEVFVVDIRNPHSIEEAQPTQLLRFRPPPGQKPFSRLRGSFRTFAVLNDDGSIYIGNQDTVFAALEAATPSPTNPEVLQDDTKAPIVLEELQNSDIVDIAFGDWHYLALTKQGKVLSWGRESGACGSLGHGTHDEASRKGVTYGNAWAADGYLNHPTQVSFDPVPGTSSGRPRFPFLRSLFAHFQPKDVVCPRAHKIAAGGWHSCALMSVEKEDLPYLDPPTAVMEVDGAVLEKGEKPSNSGNNLTQPDERSIDPNTRLQPPKEYGHPKGAVGLERTEMGQRGGFAEESMARGGNSFFGMTGGTLALGDGDRLSHSRETEKSSESGKGKEKDDEEGDVENVYH